MVSLWSPAGDQTPTWDRHGEMPRRKHQSRAAVLFPMPIKTGRWVNPREADDGLRVLICRFRPRGLRKEEETWDLWLKELAPSEALHAAFYGKQGTPITLDTYRQRFLEEMAPARPKLRELAERVARGETVTLLCSKTCLLEAACHRSIVRELIDAQLLELQGQSSASG